MGGCLALAACGSSSGGGGGGSAAGGGQAKWHASLRLDYTLNGYSVPEVVAEKKGFYSKRGLDLNVQEGSGSGTVTQQTASGVATFGEVDVSTAALYIAKGVPLKAVAVFLQKTPNGLAYDSSKVNIQQPSDIKGKNLGLVTAEAPLYLLEAAAAKNGVPADSYKKVFMSPTALPGALLSGRIDAMGSFGVGSFETIKLKNPKIHFTSFSNWGVNLLGNGLVAPTKLIQSNPDEVKALVDGTVEGWNWTVAHPKEAAQIAHSAFPTSDAAALQNGIKDMQPYLHSSETQGMPWGATTAAQWQQTIQFDQKYSGLKGSKPVSDYYTNQFTQ